MRFYIRQFVIFGFGGDVVYEQIIFYYDSFKM